MPPRSALLSLSYTTKWANTFLLHLPDYSRIRHGSRPEGEPLTIATEDVKVVDAPGWSLALASRRGQVRPKNQDAAILLLEAKLAATMADAS